MANIYDSEIRCADKKALNKLTKLILKHTPSRILGKTKDIVLFETRWSDLDYAMEVFSRDFPEVTFSCSFIHMTTCYAYLLHQQRLSEMELLPTRVFNHYFTIGVQIWKR